MNDVASPFQQVQMPALRVTWDEIAREGADGMLRHEWLLTNGLGGYANGTLIGAPSRRYHGLLVSALEAPLGRTLVLGHVDEEIRTRSGRCFRLSGRETSKSALELPEGLKEFRLEGGLPVWTFELPLGAAPDEARWVLEKRIAMVHGQNTAVIQYRLLEGNEPVELRLDPYVNMRSHDEVRRGAPVHSNAATFDEGHFEIACSDSLPPLRIVAQGSTVEFVGHGGRVSEFVYRIEKSRGYDHVEAVYSPGEVRLELCPGEMASIVCSTEAWTHLLTAEDVFSAEDARRARLLELAHPCARDGLGASLVLAADQFIVVPATRVRDSVYARAAGDEPRTVIAGYHWFTDWGRDTMIALEGLTLATGRATEAGYVLRTFARHVRDGLIPNLFPEGQHQGLYHTADASLWFFHAVERYVRLTRDRLTRHMLLPVLQSIVDHHLHGTRFGIGVDPNDGLLTQGAPGYQLTWMDAKVGDWVVTPRRGKAVEINALWYNALRLLEKWLREEGDDGGARRLANHAERAQRSFERFWYEAGGYLYDVIDGEQGDDPSCRPNQILAVSLDFPVLDPSRWSAVLDVVTKRLLTPVGLRSLDPAHPDYKAYYDGDLRARDAAYHQGTIWTWLIGPYIDAFLRVHPNDRAGAAATLEGLYRHLTEACVGSMSEIFDAEAPYRPRGCVAQAWSVAEALRAWVKVHARDVASSAAPRPAQ